MMIGPAPMIRMLSMSVRFGMSVGKGRPDQLTSPLGGSERSERGGMFHVSWEGPPRPTDQPPGGQRAERAWGDVSCRPLFHEPDEAIEQIGEIVRTGAGLGMPLKTERRPIGQGDALQTAVEQRYVSDTHVGGQRGHVDRKAVVL